ncbi:MAG: alpha-amylase family glycosyl hydrolase, partial [Candidatus Cloacimonetes bacterium]|nr:alpha-amylase family glycosyl hydrolase [Candidatus Cloacimonadota bacterium]
SHDTVRIRRLAKDELTKIMYAIFFQMTFVGIPHIYYGDEVYIDGGKDPDNRRPFNWDWQKSPTAKSLHGFYKKLIKLRLNNRLLIEGEFSFMASCPEVILYKRYQNADCLYCAINTAKEEKLLNHSGEIIYAHHKVRKTAEGMILSPKAMCIVHSKI